MNEEDDLCEIRVHSYRIGEKLGRGSFGELYTGYHVETGKPAAIKMELTTSPHPQLPWEYKIYTLLALKPHTPRVYWCGVSGDYTVLIMEQLDHSLESLFRQCHCHFSLRTIIRLAVQMIKRIQSLHEVGYIHRDIKPDNFLMGKGISKNIVHVIDFGLAQEYRHAEHKQHSTQQTNLSLCGTARYASLNNHMGISQSRRDDMEALFFVWLYFLRDGKLPWMKSGLRGKELYRHILQVKASMTMEEMCKGVPFEFLKYIRMVRELKFEEAPNYDMLLQLFLSLYRRKGYKEQAPWDWEQQNSSE